MGVILVRFSTLPYERGWLFLSLFVPFLVRGGFLAPLSTFRRPLLPQTFIPWLLPFPRSTLQLRTRRPLVPRNSNRTRPRRALLRRTARSTVGGATPPRRVTPPPPPPWWRQTRRRRASRRRGRALRRRGRSGRWRRTRRRSWGPTGEEEVGGRGGGGVWGGGGRAVQMGGGDRDVNFVVHQRLHKIASITWYRVQSQFSSNCLAVGCAWLVCWLVTDRDSSASPIVTSACQDHVDVSGPRWRSVPARLGNGQGAKEIGHNLARERPKFGHNLVCKQHNIRHSLERECSSWAHFYGWTTKI